MFAAGRDDQAEYGVAETAEQFREPMFRAPPPAARVGWPCPCLQFKTCGDPFNADWWQRVGGLFTRLVHSALAHAPHPAWLYLDDLLAALLRASAHEALLVMILLLSCPGTPISWRKACIGDSLNLRPQDPKPGALNPKPLAVKHP